MSMRDPIRRVLLHLGEYVAHNLGILVGPLARPRHIHGDVAQLWPREGMVEVVFQEVVFGEVLEVGVLDEGEVFDGKDADVHGWRGGSWPGSACWWREREGHG